jgi:fructose-1,6-bisphosphatase/sedoheptulose 1,7-bisphosphatase-like protein
MMMGVGGAPEGVLAAAALLTRIIHENFCCNRPLPAISSRARSLRFDVL